MNIFVKDRSVTSGLFGTDYITVQVIDPSEGVVWCNHDGAYSEENTVHHAYNDGTDSEYTETILQCNKCDAFKRDDEGWQDAPFEGVV